MSEHELIIRIQANNLSLDSLVKALKPETEIKLRNVHVDMHADGNDLIIVIKAPDLSALRAATNSLLRLLTMLIRTYQSIK